MRYMFLFSFVCLIACQEEVAIPDTTEAKVFFDLPAFFQEEITNLEKQVTALKKTATINGEIETQQITTFDLSQELSQFINADINKTTWQDQYQIDSTLNDNKILQSIQYTALNDNLKTKVLKVFFERGKVNKIEVIKEIDNMAVKSNQVLAYFPKKGYRITNEQSLVLADLQKVEVEVNYVIN